jgi:hypothetical protein
MSIPTQPDPTSMQRYGIESVAFAPDLGSVMIRYMDPANVGGPVLGDMNEKTIDLRDFDGAGDDYRSLIWTMVDQLCDIIDEAHRQCRRAR